jgi:hydroxyacylglutathione hydrolase
MNDLVVKKMELGPIGTNAFLLWEENGGEAILIDAPPDCAAEVNEILKNNQLVLVGIWLTHGHWDHMAGAYDLAEDGMEIIGHKDDQMMFENPSLMSTFSIPGLELKPIKITRWVKEGDELDLWGRTVKVMHCPGHCPGNIALMISDEKICFVGDVIFYGSVGRTDLPGGDFSKLEDSIRSKIYSLPDDTVLAVGHGPDTTVSREKLSNPFVRP